MQRVVAAANTSVNMRDLPLSVFGNSVGCGDVVGEKECVAGFLEDGGFHYDMSRVSDD